MKPANLISFSVKKEQGESHEVSPEQLKKINKLKRNGPNKKLKADDIFVRSIIIMGEEPTSKLSIHPEGIVNGKKLNILSQIAKLSPGAGMLDGHNFDMNPWGRIFHAEIIDGLKGYQGKVVKLWYYFLNNDDGRKIRDEIDSGIRAEGSISYQLETPVCSICHKRIGYGWGRAAKKARCTEHQIGEKYCVDGKDQTCYWYPSKIVKVLEASHVMAGAYDKTKSDYSESEDDEFVNSLCITDDMLSGNILQDDESLVDDTNQPEENNSDNSDQEPALENSENSQEDPNENPEHENSENTENETEENSNESNGGENGEDEKSGGSDSENSETETEENNSSENTPEENSGEESGTQSELPESNSDSEGGESEGDSLNTDGDGSENSETPIPAHTEDSETTLFFCYDCGKYEEVDDSNLSFSDECSDCSSLTSVFSYSDPVAFEAFRDLLFSYSSGIKPIKPAKSGQQNNEFFEKESFKNLPSAEYSVEPKYDGVWMSVVKLGDEVKIMSDSGKNYSDKFSEIVSQSKEISENFSMVGEMVVFINRKRQTHNEVNSWLHSDSSTPPSGWKFVFKPFDLLSYGSENFKKKPASERYKLQEKYIKKSSNIHPVMRKIVKHNEGGPSVVNAIDSVRTGEGAMIKDLSHLYDKSGEKLNWKWKAQQEVDCLVSEVEKKDNGFVYTCSVGRGDKEQNIGKTFVTLVKAEKGDILTVRVDHVTEKDGKFSWFSPKVFSLRKDKKQPDPLTTLRALIRARKKKSEKNIIGLSEIIPLFSGVSFDSEVYLVGSMVTEGYSEHDIDIVCSDSDREKVSQCLGEYSEFVHFVEPDSEKSYMLQLHSSSESETSENANKLEYAGKFILQEHKIGKGIHYDLRFGHDKQNKFWGYTLFKPVPTGSQKVQSREKEYGDIKWMKVNGELKPNSPGNPTSKKASMKIIDSGDYELVRRTKNFTEVIGKGETFKGRYFIREINVRSTDKNKVAEDDKTRNNKIWIIWKAKDQDEKRDKNSAVPNLNVKFTQFGILIDD